MNDQDIVNRLLAYNEHRHESAEAAYCRALHNQTIQDLIDELEHYESE